MLKAVPKRAVDMRIAKPVTADENCIGLIDMSGERGIK
jgi:hypothetical protein